MTETRAVEPWSRLNHSTRWREDTWQAIEKAVKDGQALDVTAFITEAVEARLGYVRCRRGSCMTDAPPVPVTFGDLSGKTFSEWLTGTVRDVARQHGAHKPVRIGAQPPVRSGEGNDAATKDGPSAARTEPSAPVPAPRRETGRKAEEEPPAAAADLDRDRLIAELRARIEEMEAERRNPGTAVFMEPGSAPVVGYESPEVPPPGRKRGRAGKECPHRLAPGAWCKTCEQPK